jgi:hypothetical protein
MSEESNKKTIHVLTLTIVAIGSAAVIIFSFGVGVYVGQERAKFSFGWAESYHRNFGGPMMGTSGNFPAKEYINAHGIYGTILSVNGTIIIIKGQDAVEKTVLISEKTTVRNSDTLLKAADLKAGDLIVVIGSPDDQGRVKADFIRIIPSTIPISIFFINPYWEVRYLGPI